MKLFKLLNFGLILKVQEAEPSATLFDRREFCGLDFFFVTFFCVKTKESKLASGNIRLRQKFKQLQ